MKLRKTIVELLFCCGFLCSVASCVKVDYSLGYSLVADETVYTTAVTSIPIDSMYVSMMDSLSAYSKIRIAIGAVRDDRFGLRRENSSFALVPYSDTLDWGDNVTFRRFYLAACRDTLSYYDPSQEYIMQHIRAYRLPFHIDSTKVYTDLLKKSMFEGQKEITNGVPFYSGGDSLVLEFNEEFARSYIRPGQKVVIDTLANWLKENPGVFLCTDDPIGNGGRFNFFEVAASVSSDYVLTGSYAALYFTADYTRKSGTVERVDTVFLFSLGANLTGITSIQRAFNCLEHESATRSYGEPMRVDGRKMFLTKSEVPVEGGAGIKPLIRSRDLRRLTLEALKKACVDTIVGNLDSAFLQKRIVINRATLSLPYVNPVAYQDLDFYPSVLSPTMRISKPDTVLYAGLTDALVSDANQGDIDYNVMSFHPDISHHLQVIMSTSNADTLTKENVWFMTLANETVVSSSSSSSSSDYYNQLAYMNYYNQMMGGSGYYGNSYDNYYNYYMMQSMYSSAYSSGTSTTTTQMLDRDRYYNATMCGPNSGIAKPTLELTYSFLKTKPR